MNKFNKKRKIKELEQDLEMFKNRLFFTCYKEVEVISFLKRRIAETKQKIKELKSELQREY